MTGSANQHTRARQGRGLYVAMIGMLLVLLVAALRFPIIFSGLTSEAKPEDAIRLAQTVPAPLEEGEEDVLKDQARRRVSGVVSMRKLANRAGAPELAPEAWSEGESLLKSGNRAIRAKRYQEGLESYRLAAFAFTRAEALCGHKALYEGKKLAARKALASFDVDLLKEHGAEDWAKIQNLFQYGDDNAAKPVEAILAYDSAMALAPKAEEKARRALKKKPYEDLLLAARGHADAGDWEGAFGAAAEATGSSWGDLSEAIDLLNESCTHLPDATGRSVHLQLDDEVSLELVRVPLGSGFWLGRFEVTQAQFLALTAKYRDTPPSPTNPATRVSLLKAERFCRLLAKERNIPVRLPTEAEWESACRAGTTSAYSFGDSATELIAHGNAAGAEDGFDKVAPVGSFDPNPWGLYDMHGNVMEWCSGRFDDTADSEPVFGVVRGGCWRFDESLCRSSARYRYLQAYGIDYIGFRVVVGQP